LRISGAAGKWQCDKIDSGSNSGLGKYASLDLNGSDQPRIAYYDETNHILKYAQKGGSGLNCGPSNSWGCRGIEPATDTGKFASLQVNKTGSEIPKIAYYNATTGKLKYARRVGSGGNCAYSSITLQWEWQCDTIDDMGTGLGEAGVSLAVDASDNPYIAYMQAPGGLNANRLKIARPIGVLGLLIGNCGPTGGLFNLWQCDTIDIGGPYTDEAAFAAIALNSAGLASIAYYESDTYYSTGYLKIAYQRLQLFLPLILR
jgi:hypothetical protein